MKKCQRESEGNVTFLNLNLALFCLLSSENEGYKMVLLLQVPPLVTWNLVASATIKALRFHSWCMSSSSVKKNDTYGEKRAATNVH